MSLVEARLKPFADLFDCLSALDLAFDLDAAVGKQLDVIGEYIGQPRMLNFQPAFSSALLDDDYYRLLLKSKIGLNNWNGTHQKIYELWHDTFPNEDISIFDRQDMSIDVIATTAGDPFFAFELAAHGYVLPKSMGVNVNFIIEAKKSLSITADFRGSAFVIKHDRAGMNPQRSVILGIDGIIVDEMLSRQMFTAKHEQTRETLHSGTNPVRILYLDIDGVNITDNVGKTAYTETHDKSGTKPNEAVPMGFQGIVIDEQGETSKIMVEYDQTSESLHTGTKPSKVIMIDGVTANVYEVLGKEVYGIEYERSGTEPHPSVLGETDASGIRTAIAPAEFSVKYRNCGRGVTKT
jgi:hypothetical protein